jgi:hypothetical protein
MELTGMVAEHIASLPPPPQLMAYALPRLDTRCRWCHPHGQVINPPEQVVDTVSNNEEM